MIRMGKPLWLASLASILFQAWLAYSDLPPRFASHFGPGGQPNGWMEKNPFYAVWILCTALANIGPAFVGALLKTFPPSMINLPNKAYWLSTPERKAQAIAVVQGSMAWCIFFLNLGLLMAFQGVWSFAKGGPFSFSLPIFFALVAAAVFSSIVPMLVGLRLPPDARG